MADTLRKRRPPAELTLRQERFKWAFLSDPEGNGARAAIAAGYSPRHASQRAHALLKNPLMQDAIASARAEIAERGNFNLEVAMKRLDSAAEFSRETRNATALARCIELQLRLHGLLVDKAQLQVVDRLDISGLLLEARKRAGLAAPPISPAQDTEYTVVDESPKNPTAAPTNQE